MRQARNPVGRFGTVVSSGVALGLLWLVLLLMLPAGASAAEVRLGVLIDAPKDEASRAIVNRLADEVRATLGATRPLRFDDADFRSTEWDYSSAVTHYRALAGVCDVVVVMGSGGIREVAGNGEFPCPTVGLGVFD
ncbi:MAG: hypothetical protein GY720_06070, partial [bacterium]|nr:hypothetical protein [bacterium]